MEAVAPHWPASDWVPSCLTPPDASAFWRGLSDGRYSLTAVSAFGFAGTGLHAVIAQARPLPAPGFRAPVIRVAGTPPSAAPAGASVGAPTGARVAMAPLRGALVVGAPTAARLVVRLAAARDDAAHGMVPALAAPAAIDLAAAERVAIDYADAPDLAAKATMALRALADGRVNSWRALRPRGIFRGAGAPPKIAFLYPGQGSQYPGMLALLRGLEPVVSDALAEADAALEPVLGAPLSEFVDAKGTEITNTAIAHASVIAADLALDRLIRAYGIAPDVVAGHSLGEYAAVVAAGGLTLAAALRLVSAIPNIDALNAIAPFGRVRPAARPVLSAFDGRPGAAGAAMATVMAAVMAPAEAIEPVLRAVEGYVEVAAVNSRHSTVIGGESGAVEQAVAAFGRAGIDCAALPVSAAFHTRMVADAVPALRRALVRSRLRPPVLPLVSNLTGELYPTGGGALPKVLDTLAPQFATRMSFVACVERLWDLGVRAFVEVGPKRAVYGFVADVLGDREATLAFTNHPTAGDVASFNASLCALYAAGLGRSR